MQPAEDSTSGGRSLLNETQLWFKAPFIQWAIYWIPERIRCLNESNERPIKTFTATCWQFLVSYLEYYFIKGGGGGGGFKGIVHTKKKKLIMSSCTQTWMTYFLLWNIKEGILKTVGYKAVLVTNDFHCMNKKKKKKNWDSQIILFYCMLNQIKKIFLKLLFVMYTYS